MKHLHKASGLVFECGELMESSVDIVNGIRRTYDITVITLWHDPDKDDLLPPELINYYFGEYDPDHTDYYIDRWLERKSLDDIWLKLVADCQVIVEAYWLTNKDVLADDEYSVQRTKVQQTLDALNKILEVAADE